ncbi:MAG TPA: hypothetical protein K8V79_02955 [Acinetobacter lwoffii]|uniref:Uncharacterized protein n=1 Tax=Acinetobacter lwoffii TaxID=28090 RepID=A0A9D2UR65_ACILW|nr:hypothetical protein [Acinetobacter sp. 10FS3-1]QKQ68913.1 hypothetical protein E5Y90_00915 [Acinetobacter sp. 10FS3-1]HJF27204.1 hypothetical protein [Acinetobacter lwoffii]
MWVLCGNSTDGSSPSVFQVHFLSAIRVNLINVNESLQCVLKENKNLLYQLDGLNNKKKDDYRNWKSRIKNNCENKIRYSMGEGTALEKEQCLRDEYIIRIKNISVNFHKNNNIEKNDDGFPVTSLPYNSEDHLKCILENNKIVVVRLN